MNNPSPSTTDKPVRIHPLLEAVQKADTLELDTWEDILARQAEDDLSVRDDTGCGVGHHLVEKTGNLNLLYAALRVGIDFTTPSRKGMCPIHLASNRSDEMAEMIVRWLAEHAGEDMNRLGPSGLRPLDIAGHGWRLPGLVSALVMKGANVNSRHASRRWTPLHVAARWTFNHEIIIRLIRHGADPDLVEVDGLKPADLLQANRKLDPGDRGVVLLEESTYRPPIRWANRIIRPRRYGVDGTMKAKGRSD